jgi:hypothetical protein
MRLDGSPGEQNKQGEPPVDDGEMATTASTGTS